MQNLSNIALVLVLLSSGVLTIAGVKVLLRDVLAAFETKGSERCKPDLAALLVDLSMILLGIVGATGALVGMGAL